MATRLGDAVLEATHDSIALLLIHAAVQGFGPVTATVHRGGEFVDLAPGATKDDGGDGCFHVEGAAECVGLVLAHHDVGGLAPRSVRQPCRRRRSSRARGRAGRSRRSFGSGGMVAENSTVCRSVGVSSRIVSMSSVKPMSSISSASSSTTVRMSSSSSETATDVVDRPTGGGDHDVHAAAECLELAGDGLASVDRHDLETLTSAVGVHGFADLDGELSGRDDDERLGHGRRVPAIASMMGRANAAVLPVPVAAWPSRSTPVSSWGIASAWMGVGSS